MYILIAVYPAVSLILNTVEQVSVEEQQLLVRHYPLTLEATVRSCPSDILQHALSYRPGARAATVEEEAHKVVFSWVTHLLSYPVDEPYTLVRIECYEGYQ